MRFMKYIFVLLAIFLVGCQQQVVDVSEEELPIEIISGEPIIEEIDENFDDGLDEALQELEEVENI